MSKKELSIGYLLIAMILVSVMLVPAVSGKAEQPYTSSYDVQKIKVTKSPDKELKIINVNNTSNIVKVGDTLISLDTNPEHTEAEMQIKNLTTNEMVNYSYKVSKTDGKFKTDIYQKGKLVNTVTSVYNPIAPGSMKEALNNFSVNIDTKTLAKSTQHYKWDGVNFVNGTHIKILIQIIILMMWKFMIAGI